MTHTTEYLDACKVSLQVESDYALAKKLGISTGGIANYRSARSYPDDQVCAKIAEVLGVEPGVIVAGVQVDRHQADESAATWRWIYEKVSATAAAVMLGAVLIGPSPAQSRMNAGSPADSTGAPCILC